MSVTATTGALADSPCPCRACEALRATCEPDLSLDDVANGRLARIIEETRLRRILDLEVKKASTTLELGSLRSQVRAQMNRDGVVRQTLKGVAKATLLEGRPLHECENCLAAIGEAKRGPYLKVEAA